MRSLACETLHRAFPLRRRAWPPGLRSAEEAGSALADGFEEFQPVAVRVLGIEAAHPGEVTVEPDRSALGAQPVSPGVQVTDQQARMGLAGRRGVPVHAQ